MKIEIAQTKPASTLIQTRTGVMTSELLLEPGKFGLGRVPSRLQPETISDLVCGFCSTGCSMRAHLRDGEAINLTPSPDYPVNLGMACPKGWESLTPLTAPDRLTAPLIRGSTGAFVASDWPTAIEIFCHRMKKVQATHGARSIAFLSTGQICTEEMAFLGSLFKFGMGGLHCDSNTRQCMATSHAAYKQSFGFDAPPFTYADFEASDVLIFIGANPCIAHPIMWQRVLRNPHQPQIVVVDPRKTETAMCATQHLALQPKSDLTLLYGLAHLLIQNGWVDEEFVAEHTSGYDSFAEFVRRFTPDRVALETGISMGQLYHLAETIHRGKAVSFWWTMGVNQSHESTRTAQAIINLALITGNIGRPGTGANSITGQCNAMGSRLFANATSLVGGHDFKNQTHRRKVAGILGIEESVIPEESSWAYDQILDGIERGDIRALWVIGTNTAHSWIHSDRVRRWREKLDFLVVQDMYSTTETVQMADLVLPAAGWGEKDGTIINSERRVGLVKKVRRPPGLALSDFNIFRLVATAWGCGDLFRNWKSPEAVFQQLKVLSRGQPCDFTGISDYVMLERCGGIQWPFPENSPESEEVQSILANSSGPIWKDLRERRLFTDGQFFTPDRRARLLFDDPRPPEEVPSTEFPWVLLTGRGTSAQWHTNTRTGKSEILKKLYPASIYVEIHPEDALALHVASNDRVNVISRRAAIVAAVFVSTGVQPGHLFIPMHYRETNRLTFPSFDPHSRQPSYKHCAVRVERIKSED